ncbi:MULTISPECIES: VOC family protein [Neobacillus]|uniref:VOC family protein n=1 Tax=Neobacillus rhizophilus TaxID=2833579 RepID=A0A942U331_9BACI|nr:MULTISPECIES: VOC family protein [Neobacillus]MBS4213756.1 VOC family protein [Neobacillus rhizophilus]MBU8917840.1 VOC family protein [Bacillus sp. FJAT-29953]
MSVKLIPYFVMNGTAKEAIQFYQQALDAQVLFSQSFGEMPENPEYPLPAEAKDLVSHATIKIGESEVMFSDTFPGQEHHSGNQVTICISTNDADQARKMFEGLSQGGQVGLPLQETFFSPAYGQVTDKFGITFQIFTEGKPHQ